jgi:hypothetical protein
MPLKATTAMRKDKARGTSRVTMQHRHFAFIASVLASTKPAIKPLEWSDEYKASVQNAENLGELAQWRKTINVFAAELGKTNPNFDRARFFSAVGVDDPNLTAIYEENGQWKLGRE